MVSVNNSTSGAEAHLPFGGNGKSGNGSRQSGIWVLDQFTRWQSMNWDYAGKLQKAQMDLVELPARPGVPALSYRRNSHRPVGEGEVRPADGVRASRPRRPSSCRSRCVGDPREVEAEPGRRGREQSGSSDTMTSSSVIGQVVLPLVVAGSPTPNAGGRAERELHRVEALAAGEGELGAAARPSRALIITLRSE